VARSEDAIDDSLEKFVADVGFLPLTSKLNAGTGPDDLSIPMSFMLDIVGKEYLSFEVLVVEGVFEI